MLEKHKKRVIQAFTSIGTLVGGALGAAAGHYLTSINGHPESNTVATTLGGVAGACVGGLGGYFITQECFSDTIVPVRLSTKRLRENPNRLVYPNQPDPRSSSLEPNDPLIVVKHNAQDLREIPPLDTEASITEEFRPEAFASVSICRERSYQKSKTVTPPPPVIVVKVETAQNSQETDTLLPPPTDTLLPPPLVLTYRDRSKSQKRDPSVERIETEATVLRRTFSPPPSCSPRPSPKNVQRQN